MYNNDELPLNHFTAAELEEELERRRLEKPLSYEEDFVDKTFPEVGRLLVERLNHLQKQINKNK